MNDDVSNILVQAKRRGTISPAFDLHSFFPYLVRVYYREVSDCVSQVYGSKFGLSVSEWRIIAVLGGEGVLSASDIVERSSMTKVNVSRGIKGLQKSGLLKRDIDGQDKRRASLRLTNSGIEILETLKPLLLELETQLLEGLSVTEVKTLLSAMEKVRANALRRNQSASKQMSKDLKS